MIKIMKEHKPEVLTSVDRALSLLEVLAKEENLSLTELTVRLRAEKTTVYRLAASLVERGWVVKDEELRYRLGPGALGLSSAGRTQFDIRPHLAPIMEELLGETQETIHLTRLDGRHAVYLAQLISPKPVLSVITIGSRSPAHCVSSGLAQLAAMSDSRIDWVLSAPLIRYTDASITDPDLIRVEIDRVRKRGFGINIGSYRKDVGGVGVAVLDDRGNPIAGLSVCVPVFRLLEQDTDALGKRLLRAARDSEAILRQHQQLHEPSTHRDDDDQISR